ncbi:MAG: hypothetical protein RLZZ419_835 [Pseudomonadota bacterium]|jgi:hypothetical protein
MNDELFEELSNNSDAKIRFRTLTAQGSCVEALAPILNVGTGNDFESINTKNDTAVSRLDILVINQTAKEVQEDMDTLDQWLR